MPEGGYKKFKIGDLFSAQTGDVDIQNKDITGQGVYFINSGVTNQGIKGKTERKAKVFPPNTITIDFFGNAYFRPYEYKLATHNHVFSFSGKILKTPRIGLYLVSQLSYLRKVFSYNNMGTIPKICSYQISLPLNKNGEIDYEFMESRIRELEESRIRELEAYLSEAGFDNCTLTPEEENALCIFKLGKYATANFAVEELFTIVKGKRLTKADMIPGDFSFIGASAQNNGITAKISNTKFLNPGKAITVSYNGTVGEAFFQDEPFWASDDINALYPNFTENDNVTLFFLAPLKKIGKCYSYSQKWTKEILAQNILKVPVNEAGEIDVEFMGNLINATKKTVIAKLKDFIAKEHRAYDDVTSG